MNYGSGDDSDQFSAIRKLLTDCIDSLDEGYENPVFNIKDRAQRIQALHGMLKSDQLDISTAQERCVKVDKIQEVVVNEKSGVRELNLAVLMTAEKYLGTVYFHRGNALMTAKRWSQAITDFTLAIQHGHNSREEFRLHHKIGQCFIKRKLYKQAVQSFELALKLLKSGDLAEKTKKDFSKILTDCIQKFSSKKNEEKKKVPDFVPVSPSKIDPRVTDQVEVLETIGKGRNAFAKTNISVGSVLAVVDAMGGHLNPDNAAQVLQYCLNCMIGVEVPYPCRCCPRVVFCCPECKKEAEGSYHKYQCQLDLYNIRVNDSKDGCSIFQSLSVIVSHPLSFWWTNMDEFLDPSPTGEWPVPVNDDVQKMSLLLQMATNDDQVTPATHARHTLVVILLLRSLRKTTFFEDSGYETPTGQLTPQELLLGKLIYRLRLVQDMNSHPVWGVSKSQKDKIGKDHIGAGMYTGIGSYFNSDCNPNTFRVNLGKKMLLIASKNIKRGQEVMDNYCIHFSELPTVTRRPWIQEHFLFHCECVACEDDWPTYSQLSQVRPSQKVADKLVALEMENMASIDKGDIDKAIESHGKEITLIQGGLTEPHQLPVTIRNSFQFCWWKKMVQYLQSQD